MITENTNRKIRNGLLVLACATQVQNYPQNILFLKFKYYLFEKVVKIITQIITNLCWGTERSLILEDKVLLLDGSYCDILPCRETLESLSEVFKFVHMANVLQWWLNILQCLGFWTSLCAAEDSCNLQFKYIL